jgi:hypothetical protein
MGAQLCVIQGTKPDTTMRNLGIFDNASYLLRGSEDVVLGSKNSGFLPPFGETAGPRPWWRIYISNMCSTYVLPGNHSNCAMVDAETVPTQYLYLIIEYYITCCFVSTHVRSSWKLCKTLKTVMSCCKMWCVLSEEQGLKATEDHVLCLTKLWIFMDFLCVTV